MATPSTKTPSDAIIETAKAASEDDGPITIIVILKIKPEKVARAEELWREQIDYIDATELAGNVRYSLFRRNGEGSEYTVIQEYASLAILAAFFKDPKHEEISGKVYGEGLVEGEPEARYCRRIAGTKA